MDADPTAIAQAQQNLIWRVKLDGCEVEAGAEKRDDVKTQVCEKEEVTKN